MNKKIIFIASVGLALSLAIIAISSSQQTDIGTILAQTISFSTKEFNPPSIPSAKRLPKYTIFTEKESPSIASFNNLIGLQNYGIKLINARIKALTKIKKDIGKTQASLTFKEAGAQIIDQKNAELLNLGNIIKAGTDLNTVRADVLSIYSNHRISSIYLPVLKLNLYLDLQNTYLAKLNNSVLTQVQAKIDTDKNNPRCNNSTDRQTALNEARLLAASSTQRIQEINESEVSWNITVEDYPDTYQAKINAINQHIIAIQTDLNRIKALLKFAYKLKYTKCTTDNNSNNNNSNPGLNECSSGQTGCSNETVAWTCSRNSQGAWMKNEEPCENNKKCYQGNCVYSQEQCLARLDTTPNENGLCCSPYELKKGGYSLIEPSYNLYTCCFGNQCAFKGTCVDNGYISLRQDSSFNNLPYYKCSEGQWEKQACLEYRQRSFAADNAPQCCEGLELKAGLYNDGEYQSYVCCKPEECASNMVCNGNGSRVPGYYDKDGNVVSYVCNNGTWIKDGNYNPTHECLGVRRARAGTSNLYSWGETTNHADAKCCENYTLKASINPDPAHQETIYVCCAADECANGTRCEINETISQLSDGYNYKCENGNWIKQNCFAKQQKIEPPTQGKCCSGLTAVTDNRILQSGWRQTVCCEPGECASFGACFANGAVYPAIDDEISQNPEGTFPQRAKCENGIWKVIK